MNGFEVERLQWPSIDNVDGCQCEDDREEGYENGDDHEIEAAAGSLVAAMSKGVAGESRLS